MTERESLVPLRVLQVAAPGFAGGLESVVAALSAGLCRRGHAVAFGAVLGGAEDPPFLSALSAAGVEMVRLRFPGRAYLQERQATLALAREWRADVVHTHGYRADVVAGVAAARAGIATASTVHGFTGGDWKNRLYELLQFRAFRRLGTVVAVSRPIRERLLAAGIPAPRIALIPNAWAPSAEPLSRTDARRALGISGDQPLIGWVGRLSPEKGPDIFLAALGALREHRWQASVVGDGRMRAASESLARELGIGARLRWHGMVAEAGRLVAAFDCLVLSSRTEGTPIVLFEAMAAGVPVVAAAVGGVPDVLGADEALLVPGEQPSALASAITRVLDAPVEAAARAARARSRLERQFSAEPWLARHEALYRTLLAQRGR